MDRNALIFRNDPLPKCEGPKMHPFKDRKSEVKFLSLLSEPDSESRGSGGHGYVFKVSINTKLYALKIVSAHSNTSDGDG
jgi:hypothetical protein